MDSGNSGSFQSSSGGGGGDDFGDSHQDDSLSALFRQQNASRYLHYHRDVPRSLSALHDLLPEKAASSAGADAGVMRASCLLLPPAAAAGASQSFSAGRRCESQAFIPTATTATVAAVAGTGSTGPTVAAPRSSRKRTRASRRAPTTVLTTDTNNFRAMVQEFTGIPSPPFAIGPSSPSTGISRTRFDHLFPPSGSASLLRSPVGGTDLGTSLSSLAPQLLRTSAPKFHRYQSPLLPTTYNNADGGDSSNFPVPANVATTTLISSSSRSAATDLTATSRGSETCQQLKPHVADSLFAFEPFLQPSNSGHLYNARGFLNVGSRQSLPQLAAQSSGMQSGSGDQAALQAPVLIRSSEELLLHSSGWDGTASPAADDGSEQQTKSPPPGSTVGTAASSATATTTMPMSEGVLDHWIHTSEN